VIRLKFRHAERRANAGTRLNKTMITPHAISAQTLWIEQIRPRVQIGTLVARDKLR
jgi:hypothetical protein